MRKNDRKEWKLEQLCRQAERRLALAVGELDDPLMEGLQVDDVQPAAGGAGMMVIVRLPPDAEAGRTREVRRRLEEIQGLLRSEVAAAIHRKKTPQLFFTVLEYDESEVFED